MTRVVAVEGRKSSTLAPDCGTNAAVPAIFGSKCCNTYLAWQSPRTIVKTAVFGYFQVFLFDVLVPVSIVGIIAVNNFLDAGK